MFNLCYFSRFAQHDDYANLLGSARLRRLKPVSVFNFFVSFAFSQTSAIPVNFAGFLRNVYPKSLRHRKRKKKSKNRKVGGKGSHRVHFHVSRAAEYSRTKFKLRWHPNINLGKNTKTKKNPVKPRTYKRSRSCRLTL